MVLNGNPDPPDRDRPTWDGRDRRVVPGYRLTAVPTGLETRRRQHLALAVQARDEPRSVVQRFRRRTPDFPLHPSAGPSAT